MNNLVGLGILTRNWIPCYTSVGSQLVYLHLWMLGIWSFVSRQTTQRAMAYGV